MSWLSQPLGTLGNPAFLLTFGVIQVGLMLVAVRYLDIYGRQPLGLVILVAAWGATGAAAISVAGNRFVGGLLSGDVHVVFGNAISAPLVEESAKGIALIAAVGPVRALARRAGVRIFEGPGAGAVYGAAVGLGFGFTEDLYFLVDKVRTAGVDAGFNTFLYRRDFFGPAILHHAVFTAAFGAGLGLAISSTSRVRKIAAPAVGFALAVVMHAVNNGLVELGLVVKYGIRKTAVWSVDQAQRSPVADTAAVIRRFMRALDFYYLAIFVGLMILWNLRQRRVIRSELEEEIGNGLIKRADVAPMFDLAERVTTDWRLLRSGQLEGLRHHRQLRRQLAQLGVLKGRMRRFGDDLSRVNRARREIATFSTFDVTDVKLPSPPSPLIGRERELEEIAGYLHDHDVRVVTLLGPGGTGKTRLAIEVASLQRDRFAGGVYFVDLAPLTDPDLVPQAIADVLQVGARPGEPVIAVLQQHLRDKQLRLVLDNFEQVSAAATVVAEILTAAARVKVFATSREPLRISGEHQFHVSPLELPDPKAAAGNAAVALFVDRARAVDPRFELTEGNSAVLAEICIGLDGLPLAIELAAAHMNVLTPEALLDRLGGHLETISAGSRDLPVRHQTLRSTMDWSYGMLSGSERALFKRFGVFVDGASIDAVEAVCLDADGSPARGDIGSVALSDLASLRDKSLVRRGVGAGSQPRFTMLTTIRDYALERLRADGALSETRERHARHFARLAEEAEAHLVGPEQAVWFERLDREIGNLRAVLQWSAEAGQDELGLRVVGALPRFWSMRGLSDTSRWLSDALARRTEVHTSVRAKALYAEGYAALDRDLARAETSFEASLAAYRELDEQRGIAASLAQLGFVLMSRGQDERAIELVAESVELARRVGDANVESVALATLAEGAAGAGDYERASDLFEQSLTLRRKLGDRRNTANALLNLGRVALVSGNHKRAQRLLEQGLATAREVADTWSISVGLASLGRLALLDGEDAEGRALLGQALELAVERGGKRLAAECVTALADAASRTAPHRSARLFGAAEALQREIGIRLSSIEGRKQESVDRVRAALGDHEFTTDWSAGHAYDIDATVAFALSEETDRCGTS